VIVNEASSALRVRSDARMSIPALALALVWASGDDPNPPLAGCSPLVDEEPPKAGADPTLSPFLASPAAATAARSSSLSCALAL